jgi:hypothetical protein
MRNWSFATNGCTLAFALAIVVPASACSSNAPEHAVGSDASGMGPGAAGTGTDAGASASGDAVGASNTPSSIPATPGLDNGVLFTDAAAISPPDARSGMISDAAMSKTDGPPGDGHVGTINFGFYGLTAVFTQKGTDVTMVLTATQGCPVGNHVIQVHAGYACDNATLMGPVWDGKRGDGIGGPSSSFMCDASGRVMMTYTRSGADPTTNWTVADQNLTTDVTLHVILVDGRCAAFL